jgi:hypothetical protein
MWKYRPHRNIAVGLHERGVERGISLGIVYSLSVDARDEIVGVTPRCRVSAGTAALRPAAVSVKARDRQADCTDRQAEGPGSSGYAIQQLTRRGQLEPSREADDRVQARRALATLEQADLRPVQVAKARERFLRKTKALTVAAEVRCESGVAGIHGRKL